MLSLDYIGGLFDGDGHVSLARRDRKSSKLGLCSVIYTPIIGFSQSDEGLLEAVSETLAGKVRLRGKAGGTNAWGVKRNRDSYQLSWSNRRAAEVLRTLIPYAVARKPEMQIVLGFYDRYANYTKGWGRGSPESRDVYHARRIEMVEAAEQARLDLQETRIRKNTYVH